ncbi:MAG TPA: hypothetical protein VF202_05140 [Trueperaceae bacterium]
MAPVLAAFALAAGAVALGLGPPGRGRPASLASLAARPGAAGDAALPSLAQRGAYYGWVAPGEARVWLEAAPCPAGDPPARATLEGGTWPAALLGRRPPPLTFPLGAAAVVSLPGSSGPVRVLDVGSGLVGEAGSTGDDADATATYTRARVVCRSWQEAAWDVGALGVARVDAPASDDLPLTVYLVPEPAHTGVLGVLLFHARTEPVTIEAVGYAPDGVANGRVIVGVGRVEHWQEWLDALRRWSEAGARGEVDMGPPPVRPYWLPDGPTPPLLMEDADDLGLVLEPHSSALVAIGTWSFSRPPDLLLTFPTFSYVQGGAERRVGLTEPLRQAAWRR